MTNRASILVVGLGNRFHKDDGVGLMVSDMIKAQNNGCVETISGVTDAARLIDAWSKASRVYVVDAVISEADAGTIYRFDAMTEAIPEEIFSDFSTHSFSVVETIKLAKNLGELPDSLILYCIEGSDFDMGTGVTPKVRKAAKKVSTMINKEIEEII